MPPNISGIIARTRWTTGAVFFHLHTNFTLILTNIKIEFLTLLTFHGLTIYETYLNSVNCTKSGHLILRRIIKIVATRCHILGLKCTKFDFGWGSAPYPSKEAYSTPPDSLAALKWGGLLLRGGRERKEEEGEGKGGDFATVRPPTLERSTPMLLTAALL